MAKSDAYWINRAAQRTVDYHADAERTANEIGKAYYSAAKQLEEEASKVFKGFQKAFNLSEDEAKSLLGSASDKSALQALKAAVSKISDPAGKEKALAAISSPAYQWRINRLDSMDKKITEACNSLYDTELSKDTTFLSAEADKAYKNTVFDIQKGTGTSGAFDVMPESRINQILQRNWSGENYSSRIWGNTQQLASDLKQDMLQGMMTGASEQDIAKNIVERCNVGFNEARRLVRTETTYVTNQAELESYKGLGIDSYQYTACLDNRTSEMCSELDGKEFLVSEAVPGQNLPPMHPYCRSTTIAVLPSEEELDAEYDELADEIGADVDFDEWVKGLEQGEDGKLRYVSAENRVDNSAGSGIIKEKAESAVNNVYSVGKIDRNIYSCVTPDITTDEVIITDERIQHIKDRHPNNYERYCEYIAEAVKHPDFIIEANKPNSALILKSFHENSEEFKMILRLKTSADDPSFKNSIITFMKINRNEWKRLLKNKKTLYKCE